MCSSHLLLLLLLVGWLVAYQSHHQSSVKERHDVCAPGTRARAVLFGPAGRGRIELDQIDKWWMYLSLKRNVLTNSTKMGIRSSPNSSHSDGR